MGPAAALSWPSGWRQGRSARRMLFGGNLLRQPVFQALLRDQPQAIRSVVPQMEGADRLMEQTLFWGTYPGLTEAMLQRELGIMLEFTR